ncbi:hypothetical protein JCM10207_002644 [Rhodosporidiobolus poonsookiae]
MSRAHSAVNDSPSESYPPYALRPAGDAVSSAAHGGPFRPLSTVGAAVSPREGRGEKTSQAAGGGEFELTQADKQEGYDVDLLNLPERNTAAQQAAEAEALKRVSSPPPAGTVASALPYATRARDESPRGGKERPSRDVTRKGVRHHSSAAKHDGHRSNGANGGSRKRSTRRSRKAAKWYQKPIVLAAIALGVVVIGLAVGLGVGLGANKSDDGDDKSASSATSAGTGSGPSVSVSDVDVQPSASAADGGDGGVEISQSGAATVIPSASATAVRAQERITSTPTPVVSAKRWRRELLS